MPTRICQRLLLAVALAGSFAAAAHGGIPTDERLPLNSRPVVVIRGAASTALARQVVMACGHSEDVAVRAERELAEHIEALRRRGTVAGDPRSQARAIHEYIHAEILRGKYDPAASDLAAVLEGGSYNCASVSALFLTFAGALDLDARAASVVGHVWCRVRTASGPFEIETTCRDWFVLVEEQARLSPRQRAQSSPAWQQHWQRVAQARELDRPAFLAVFHYNRGVSLLRQQQFSAAAGANLAALRLDWRCQPAYGNLWAALTGWSRQSDGPRTPAVAFGQPR